MARISFTADERPRILARLVVDHGYDNKLGRPLQDLAGALLAKDGRRFDELLLEHYRETALREAGLIGEDDAVVAEPDAGEA